MIAYDEIMYIMDIISNNVTNTIATNATSSMSINYHDEKRRHEIDYILVAFLLVIIVLFIITFICHYYINRSKQKHNGTLMI